MDIQTHEQSTVTLAVHVHLGLKINYLQVNLTSNVVTFGFSNVYPWSRLIVVYTISYLCFLPLRF